MSVRLRLHPQGTTLDVERGTQLHDVLFAHGVEFPCGGRGRCKGCRVRVLEGSLPLTPEQERMLLPEEIHAGWRLSCQCRAEEDMTLELAQWEASVLTDETHFKFRPRHGLGVAIDLGTTTIVAQLLDMENANVLAVRTALNPQARYGADVMSRIGFAVAEGGQAKLVSVVRAQVGKMVLELLEAAGRTKEPIDDIVIVGNTVMCNLFADLDLEPLSHYPFESGSLGEHRFWSEELGWSLRTNTPVRFLSCIGGFIGSDILAGVVATEVHLSDATVALVDLGTNGEIVMGNSKRLVCSSTAAGPAFEGARIYMGMRAATGAISEVRIDKGRLVCSVLGNVTPKGICGSGLVDAVAAWLDLGSVGPNGRISNGEMYLSLCPPVRISQTDIRELQLAKGAIAAGMRILLEILEKPADDLQTIYLAGAFGNYVNAVSAVRIGLIPFPNERIRPVGNSALRGAKIALFLEAREFTRLASSIRHISLLAHPRFHEVYIKEMGFPAGKAGVIAP